MIAEIETDKATMEVESVDEGTLGKIVVAEGSQGVKVNEFDRLSSLKKVKTLLLWIMFLLMRLRLLQKRLLLRPLFPAEPKACCPGYGS